MSLSPPILFCKIEIIRKSSTVSKLLTVDFNNKSLMCWHSSEPKSRSEIVAACQKCRRGW